MGEGRTRPLLKDTAALKGDTNHRQCGESMAFVIRSWL